MGRVSRTNNVSALAELEKIVGRRIPVAMLFRGPTVATLAQIMSEETEAEPEPLGTEFHRGDGQAPSIFAVAAPGIRTIALLSRHFDANQGFYKLQAQAPVVQGRPLNPVELRALAKQYLAGIRAVQREGPYYLAAMCGGCQIAEQMILQLESQGQGVGLFVIFDTWVMERVHSRWGWHVSNYQLRAQWMRNAGFRESLAWIKRATVSRIRIWTGRVQASKPWVEAYWPENFQTPRFRAPIVLFKRPKQLYYYINDPLLGWGARSEGVHEINADHREVLREPPVKMISEIIVARVNHFISKDTAPAITTPSKAGGPAIATPH